MKRKFMAVLLTAALVMSSEVPVFASDNTGEVYSDGETHDVSGGDEGVGASGENTVVNVTGNVTGQAVLDASGGSQSYSGSAVAVDGGVVNITGNVGDGANDSIGVHAVGGEVNVNGDVSGVEDAIIADHATVNVDGNVTGSVVAEDDSTVQITGNLQGTTGDEAGDPDAGGFAYPVISDFNSNIVVDGNVSSGTTAIKTHGGSTIVITETLTSGGSEPAIVFDHSMEVVTPADPIDPYSFPTTDIVNNPDATASTILVYEINGNLQNLVKSGYTNSDFDFIEDTDSTLKNSQLNNIFYIIKKAADSVANILGLSGTQTKEEYDVAKAGTALTVTVKEGYGLTAGTIAVTKNSDGTYTLTVPQGGGVTLTAEQIQEAVKETEQQAKQPATQPSFNPEQFAALLKALHALQPAANEPITEETASNSNPNATASSAVVVPPLYVTADPTTIGETAYVASVTASIANAPYGGTVKLTTGDAAFINRSIIDALETRADVTLEISVLYGGVPYVIHIPAGFKLRELLGSHGKIDMNKLISMFGVQL